MNAPLIVTSRSRSDTAPGTPRPPPPTHATTHSSRRPASPSPSSLLGSASRLVALRLRTTPWFPPVRAGLHRHASCGLSAWRAPRNQVRLPPLLACRWPPPLAPVLRDTTSSSPAWAGASHPTLPWHAPTGAQKLLLGPGRRPVNAPASAAPSTAPLGRPRWPSTPPPPKTRRPRTRRLPPRDRAATLVAKLACCPTPVATRRAAGPG